MLVLLRNTGNGRTCARCAVLAECSEYGGEDEYRPDGLESCLTGPYGVESYYAIVEPTQDFDGEAVGAALATGSGV